MTKKRIVLMIAENAIVAAIYFVLTIAIQPLAYGMLQCRISEIMVLLAFWRPDFIIGLTLGCFIANILSPMAIDMLFGTLATLLAVAAIAYLSPRLYVAIIWPVIFNGIIVGIELYYFLDASIALWVQMGWVALGELAVMVAGYIIFVLLNRSKTFRKFLAPYRHVDVKW